MKTLKAMRTQVIQLRKCLSTQTPYPAIPCTASVELTPARSDEKGAKDRLTDLGSR